jgi:hypothetical protein
MKRLIDEPSPITVITPKVVIITLKIPSPCPVSACVCDIVTKKIKIALQVIRQSLWRLLY